MSKKIRIGTLISGTGTNLQAIIDACEQGRVDGEIVFIGSDNPQAVGLQKGPQHGIPTFVVDYRTIISSYRSAPSSAVVPLDFDLQEVRRKQTRTDPAAAATEIETYLTGRAIAEAALLGKMAAWPYDLLVLAGFMRTLTPYFIDRVNGRPDIWRIMNIHPALLPAFPGTDGYGDTFRYGCKIAGCTVHFIDYGEDTGPIIGQRSFPIDADDTLEQVRRKGLALEWKLYPECVQLFAQGRLKTVRLSYQSKGGQTMERTVVKILPKKDKT